MTIGETMKIIREARIREREKLDKLLVTLSAGTFVLSVTFVTGIIDIGLYKTWLLFTSWFLLLSSIFLIIIAYIVVDHHFDRQERRVINNRKYGGWLGKIVELMTFFSALLLIAGIIFLALFAASNILAFNSAGSELSTIE